MMDGLLNDLMKQDYENYVRNHLNYILIFQIEQDWKIQVYKALQAIIIF